MKRQGGGLLAEIGDSAAAEPALMGLGAVASTERLLQRGFHLKRPGIIEINERSPLESGGAETLAYRRQHLPGLTRLAAPSRSVIRWGCPERALLLSAALGTRPTGGQRIGDDVRRRRRGSVTKP